LRLAFHISVSNPCASDFTEDSIPPSFTTPAQPYDFYGFTNKTIIDGNGTLLYDAPGHETKPKALYGHVNKTKSGIAKMHRKDETIAETDKEKAQVLNEFFASVMTVEDTIDIPALRENEDRESKVNCIEISEEETMKQLAKLKPNKSQEPDRIHPRVLKEAAKELAKPLTVIFKKINRRRNAARQLEIRQDHSHIQNGEKTDPRNYRPVSMTSIVCNMLESIVRQQVI
jgi:hypothetical protein